MSRTKIRNLGPFWRRLNSEILPVIDLITKGANRKITEARYSRFLLGDDLPEDKLPFFELTTRQKFFRDVFLDYGEIHSALQRLLLTEEFVKKIKYKNADSEVLSYHMEKHLEEIYIIKVRIVSFFRKISRVLTKKGLRKESQKVSHLEKTIEKIFSDIVKTRGSHIHERRLSDPDLQRLSTLDLLIKEGDMKELLLLRELAVRSMLKKWRETIKSNNENIEELMKTLFSFLIPLIFDQLGPKLS